MGRQLATNNGGDMELELQGRQLATNRGGDKECKKGSCKTPPSPPTYGCVKTPTYHNGELFCESKNYQKYFKDYRPEPDDCCRDDYCMVCHPNGCDQCCEGYFKPGDTYPCMTCEDYDRHATKCNDYAGAAECESGYRLEYHSKGEYVEEGRTMGKCREE